MVDRYLGVLCLLFVVAQPTDILRATTIVPYKNIGELSIQADAVVRARATRSYKHNIDGTTYFRTKFVVLDQVTGNLQKGDDFEVQKWEKVIDGKWMTMWGDLDLYDGSVYLLFLERKGSGLYHPYCFSYYLFEEITMEGKSYMVPSIHASEFELANHEDAEPLAVYEKNGLMQEISSVVSGQKDWEPKSFETSFQHEDFFERMHQRAAPAHCNYLSSNSQFFRWKDFETQNVAVHYSAAGQQNCGTANAYAQQSITDLNSAYPGINLVDGGTVPALASCGDGSALGSDYRSWINTNLGGQRHVVIQYDDPCEEISALSGCSGILAIGGLYSYGSHSFNEETWFTGSYGYVIVNDGVGACKCGSQMGDILTHEVTHAMGLGHILSSNGIANMNPSCCQDITALDQSCMLYPYSQSQSGSLLPMELISFDGNAEELVNDIFWKTAWEASVDKYVLQRSSGGEEDFKDIAEITSKGDTEFGHNYSFTDLDPELASYYRLMSKDHSGETSYSNLVIIEREKLKQAILYPTQTKDRLNLRLPSDQIAQFQILTPAGQLQHVGETKDSYTVLSVGDLPNGWYYLQLASEDYNESFKFFKMN